MFAQLAKFAYAGIANTVIGYLIIFTALFVGVSPYLSNMIGYGIGLILSFHLNKHYVFLHKQSSLTTAPKFFSAFIVAYTFNLLVLYIAIRLSWNIYLAQVIAGVGYLSVMYFLSKKWVFKT